MNSSKRCLVPFLAITLMYSSAALTDEITSGLETVYVYSEYGNGDVVFTSKTKHTTCYGYWLSADYAGFDQVYSMLLSAFHANTAVALTVNTDLAEKWSGSTNHYCKLIRVSMSK